MNIRHFSGVALIATGLAVLSCGGPKQLQLTSSSDIPAGESTAKLSTTNDGNTKIDLMVKHLASPERVARDATVYVVWVRGNDTHAEPQNLGALKVDDNLNGDISVMTPLREFDLYVTAEPSQQTTTPSGKALFYTTVTMRK
jgi:hypothetical protein